MPIYEFQCEECGRVSEILVFSAGNPIKCPECGSERLKKLMSATSSLSGSNTHTLPGPNDTGCCGARPHEAAGCKGPGSCCGKA